MSDLEQIIFTAIARNPPSKQPAAVLAAIGETHYIVGANLAESLVEAICALFTALNRETERTKVAMSTETMQAAKRLDTVAAELIALLDQSET